MGFFVSLILAGEIPQNKEKQAIIGDYPQNYKLNAIIILLKRRYLYLLMKPIMNKIFTFVALSLSAICLCIAQQTQQAQSTATTKAVSDSYKLRPLDLLTMSMFQEPDMQKIEARISTDGYILLPLIDKVSIAGLTLSQAQEKITNLYKEYFVDPQVSLFILMYAKQSCYVVGFVNQPREYEFPIEEGDKMTITKVIAGCNGFSPRANRTDVVVKRKLPNGKDELYNINVKAILNNKDAADFPILNGDVIEVKEDIF